MDQLTNVWQQFLKQRFVAVTTGGGRDNQSLWVNIEGRRINARCFGDVRSGDCMAVQLDNGEWVLVNSQVEKIPEQSQRNLELRRTKPKKKKLGSVQILFYEIVGPFGGEQTINWYIGGDRPSPLLIHTEPYAGEAAEQIEDGVFFPQFELSDLINLGNKKFIACLGNRYKTPAINRIPINPDAFTNLEADYFKIVYINNENNGSTTLTAKSEYSINYLVGYDHTKAYRYLGEGYLAGTTRVIQRAKLDDSLNNYYQDIPEDFLGKTYYITPDGGELVIDSTVNEHGYTTQSPLLNTPVSFNSTYAGDNQLTRTFSGENIILIGGGNTKITEYLTFDQQGSSITQSREIRFYRGNNYTLLNTLDGVRVNHNLGNRTIHNLNLDDTFTVTPEPNNSFFYEPETINSPSTYFPSLVGQEVLFSNIFGGRYYLARCQVISYGTQFTLQLLEQPRATDYCSFGSTFGSFILNNGSFYNLVAVNDPTFTYNAIITNQYLSPTSNISNTTDFKKSDPEFPYNPDINFLNPRYAQVDLFGATPPGEAAIAYLRYTDNRLSRLSKNTLYKVKPIFSELSNGNAKAYIEKWKIVGGNFVRAGTEKVRAYQLKTDTPEEEIFFRFYLDVDFSPD